MISGTELYSAPSMKSAGIIKVAKEFEASFLAEMLRYSGIGSNPGAFGGGSGESQFAPMLADHYSQALVKAGGIGLAERITSSLLADYRK